MLDSSLAWLALWAVLSPTTSSLQYSIKRSSPNVIRTTRAVRDPVRTLLIDNYDSYTYNVWQMVAEVNGVEPLVVANDAFQSWDDLLLQIDNFDNVILSPGPGHPSVPSDFGICKEAILRCKVPLLGVCLGHQGLATAYGGTVTRANTPMHGRLSPIIHTGSDILKGVNIGSQVVRYHSLVIDPTQLPLDLEITAWTADNEIMAVRHRLKEQYGVQFHPESIKTQEGQKIFENFRTITQNYRDAVGNYPTSRPLKSWSFLMNNGMKTIEFTTTHQHHDTPQRKRYVASEVFVMPKSVNPINLCEVFDRLYGQQPISFFLDSSCPGPQQRLNSEGKEERQQISYMGAVESKASKVLLYNRTTNSIAKYTFSSSFENSSLSCLQLQSTNEQDIWDYLQNDLQCEQVLKVEYNNRETHDAMAELPFVAGYFGYLGYELGERLFHNFNDRHQTKNGTSVCSTHSYPDATLMFVDQYLTFDHKRREFRIVAFQDYDCDAIDTSGIDVVHKEVSQAVDDLMERLRSCVADIQEANKMSTSSSDAIYPKGEEITRSGTSIDSVLYATKSAEEYRQDIATCLDHIRCGDSYEVCLTSRFRGPLRPEHRNKTLAVYRQLCEKNPAPHAAYLRVQLPPRLENEHHTDFAVCCTSPEQYLKIDQKNIITSKPIKGTARRHRPSRHEGMSHAEYEELQKLSDRAQALKLYDDEKSQAENLMIVDLVRNDLGRVCEVGSVHVPSLMEIETFTGVHQMVSTIRGTLRKKDCTAVDVLKATFPGGSMTGAPKLRTMQLIRHLEGASRGIYSGGIGYIGLNGALDLNIVIRTAIVQGEMITIGAGGAIVALSDPQEEVDEVLLKAQTVAKSLGYTVSFASPSELP